MRFEPIDIDKHKEYIIPFRRDSFIVSFGTDEAFGDEGEYLDWVMWKSNEFHLRILLKNKHAAKEN